MGDLQVLKPACLAPESLAVAYGLRLLLPLIFGGIFFLWFPFSRILSKITGGKFPTFKIGGMLNTTGMIICSLYISLVCSTVAVLECKDNPNGKKTIRTMAYVQCWTDEHMETIPLVVIALLIY